jgi:hypothetical protein
MNKKLLFTGLVISIIIIAIAGSLAVSNYFEPSETYIIIDFDPAAARAHVVQLISNGPRMSGSPAEEMGAEYIVSQFKQFGLTNCQVEKYSVNMFNIEQAEFSMIQYGPLMRIPNPAYEEVRFTHMVDFVLQGFSGSHDWTDFRDDMEVAVIGNGTAASAYSDASGMACLIEVDDTSPGNPDVYRYANDAGVRAIVLQNLRAGEEIEYPPFFKSNQAYEDWGGNFPEIPFFMVSKDVGETIKSHTIDSKLRIKFNVEKGPMDICVAVGEIRGSEHPEELFIIGGHHDTCYNTLGVVDNTVGPALIMEMARQMAVYNPKYTIRFCTFGGEEEGLYGSTAYFAAHEKEFMGKVRMYSNFDMSHTDIIRVNRFTVTTSINSSIKTFEKILDKVIESTPALEKYEVSIRWDDGKWAGSDQWPFASHGIDVTNAWGGGCYEYHTYKDDISHLNEESLQIGARIVGSYIINEAI